MRLTSATFTVIASAVASVLPLTACGPSNTTASTQSGVPSSAAATSGAAQSPAATQSAAPTSLDPCQLVTSSEASALAGTTFGPGKEEKSGTNGKLCVYGYQTSNVFIVVVGQSATKAAAQAAWSHEQSRAQAALKKQVPAGISIAIQTKNVSGLADRAATVTGSATVAGQTIGESAIYLLKGITFLSFSDLVLGHAAPGAAAMEAEADKALARVP